MKFKSSGLQEIEAQFWALDKSRLKILKDNSKQLCEVLESIYFN